ncbi:BapA/Bap/LapF family prefix-like domain-containing protein, partial [Providencia rettgeri]
MSVVVIGKHKGEITEAALGNVQLDHPSIVKLKISPEHVSRFEQQGNDLILIMTDGRAIVIADFFNVEDGERSELVLEDESEVLWWGQYGEGEWSEFQFTEIILPTEVAALPPTEMGMGWWSALIGLVSVGGVIAASNRASNDNDTPTSKPEQPDAPSVTIDPIELVTDPKAGETKTITGKIDSPEGTVPNSVTVTVGGKEYPAIVNDDATWTVDVPVAGLTENTPVTATGTSKDPENATNVSEPGEPAKSEIPVLITPEQPDAPSVTIDP